MTIPAEQVTLPARGWRIDPRHALIAAAVCWTGFAAVVLLMLGGKIEDIDKAGLLFWRADGGMVPRGPAWVLEAVRDTTALGGVFLRNLFAIAAIAALLFLRLRREAFLFAATVISAWGVNSAIKLLVGRERPTIVAHLTDAGGHSFPSGHSFNSAVVYIAMALAFAAFSRRRSVRWTIIASAAVATVLIAVSRVWLGVHYPSDVAAGWLGGAGWAFLAAALLYRPAQEAADETDPEG